MPDAKDIAKASKSAIARLAGKAVVGAPLKSEEWSPRSGVGGVPKGLRDQAFWMARVEDVKALDSIKKLLVDAVDYEQTGGAPFMDRGRFQLKARDVMQASGLDDGTGKLTNPASPRRLKLVYDFQMQSAYSYGRYKQGQDTDLLDAYPAQEFLRVEYREKQRDNWGERWAAAGGKTYDGRMIALKTDPVWSRLSRFGTPYPPFDFGSGMGVENVERDEAESLGVMAPGEVLQPVDTAYAADLHASVTDLSPDAVAQLKESFGKQVEISDGIARWRQ